MATPDEILTGFSNCAQNHNEIYVITYIILCTFALDCHWYVVCCVIVENVGILCRCSVILIVPESVDGYSSMMPMFKIEYNIGALTNNNTHICIFKIEYNIGALTNNNTNICIFMLLLYIIILIIIIIIIIMILLFLIKSYQNAFFLCFCWILVFDVPSRNIAVVFLKVCLHCQVIPAQEWPVYTV